MGRLRRPYTYLGSFGYGIGTIATEVSATIEANNLDSIVHAANANVAHFWMLECLTLSHLSSSRIVGFERGPVDSQDDPVSSSISASRIGPSWNPVQWNSTDVNGSAMSSHIVADIVVAQLQQATTRSQSAMGREEFPVLTLLANDVGSLNWWLE